MSKIRDQFPEILHRSREEKEPTAANLEINLL